MTLHSLRGRKVAERIRRKGKRWRGEHMNILWLPGYPYEKKSEIFAGLQASTKLHKSAVKRNRMRRRCREALRITLRRAQGDTQNCQLIITPRSSSLSADFAELQKDTEHFLMHLQKEQRQTLR